MTVPGQSASQSTLRIRWDLFAVAGLFAAGFVLSDRLELFEGLGSFVQAHPSTHLDEIAGAFVASAPVACFLALRARAAHLNAVRGRHALGPARPMRDVGIVVAVFLTALGILDIFSLNQRLAAVDQLYPDWHIDDVAIGLASAACGLVWTTMRSAKQTAILHAVAGYSMALRKTNAVLQDRTHRLEETSDELARAWYAAQCADRLKAEILNNVSHELRTPLNAIIGLSEYMLTEPVGTLQPTYKEYLRLVLAGGESLLHVISNVLDMAQIEAEAMVLRPERVDLAALVRSCADKAEAAATAGGLELGLVCPPGLTAFVDRVAMTNLVDHLLDNGVKFTPAGGKVELSVGRTADRDGSLQIVVSDTGAGMSGEEIAVALQSFRQVDGSLTRSYQGTGLGLPLAKAIAELHGGTLSIDSTPGLGTAAIVRLPAAVMAFVPPRDEEGSAGCLVEDGRIAAGV